MKAPRLKNSVIAYLIVFSEYGMTIASISSVDLPLTATPKLVKRGNKIVIHLCKRTKAKITDIAYNWVTSISYLGEDDLLWIL